MPDTDLPILTLLLLAALGGVPLALLGGALRLPARAARLGALLWSTVPLALALLAAARYSPALAAPGAVQLAERAPWVLALPVNYAVGVDGLSLPLLLLVTLLTPVALCVSWGEPQQPNLYRALIFALQAALVGCLVSLDFVFFFTFYELSLVPAYFLIARWGRDARRAAAARMFLIYTIASSLGILLLLQLLYLATRHNAQVVGSGVGGTFDMLVLARLGQGLPVAGYQGSLQTILFSYLDTQTGVTDALGRYPLLYASIAFWALFVGFAVKLGLWPFHTWLPDTYAQAPSGAAVLVAGALSKLGVYGMLRLMVPLFPEAARVGAPLVAALALVSVLSGALGALRHARGDLPRAVAYTSINHMGFVGLAVAALCAARPADLPGAALAFSGASFMLVAHGLSTAALFVLAAVLAARFGSWDLATIGGGLRDQTPRLAGLFAVALFANLGLPGLAGFIGEFLIMRGVWPVFPIHILLACFGLALTALALLRVYGALFHGPRPADALVTSDLAAPEPMLLGVLPLLVLLVLLGVYPGLLLNIIQSTLNFRL